MELNSLYTAQAHNAGAEMRLLGPDGSSTDVYLLIAGVDSDVWRKAIRESQRAAVERLVAGEASEEKDNATLLSMATLDWRGLTDNGEEVEFSPEKAEELYRNAPYIADQVDRFIAKRANFTQG